MGECYFRDKVLSVFTSPVITVVGTMMSYRVTTANWKGIDNRVLFVEGIKTEGDIGGGGMCLGTGGMCVGGAMWVCVWGFHSFFSYF